MSERRCNGRAWIRWPRLARWARATPLVPVLAALSLAAGFGHADSPPPRLTPDLAQKWAVSCALCHAGNMAGAPRAGVNADWSARLAQGRETLLRHTLEGFNDMPPLGYCMSCEAADFAALIDFMAPAAP